MRDLMTERPRTDRAGHAAHATRRASWCAPGSARLPVVDDDGGVLGMLSERELMRHLLTTQVFTGTARAPRRRQRARATTTVRDVMTRQVLCVAPEQPLAEVAALMSNKDVERVPVVRDGRLVGFLTRGDIVRKLIRHPEHHDDPWLATTRSRSSSPTRSAAARRARSSRTSRSRASRSAPRASCIYAGAGGEFYAVHRERPFYGVARRRS